MAVCKAIFPSAVESAEAVIKEEVERSIPLIAIVRAATSLAISTLSIPYPRSV